VSWPWSEKMYTTKWPEISLPVVLFLMTSCPT
jgi:hypothetical protein